MPRVSPRDPPGAIINIRLRFNLDASLCALLFSPSLHATLPSVAVPRASHVSTTPVLMRNDYFRVSVRALLLATFSEKAS